MVILILLDMNYKLYFIAEIEKLKHICEENRIDQYVMKTIEYVGYHGSLKVNFRIYFPLSLNQENEWYQRNEL